MKQQQNARKASLENQHIRVLPPAQHEQVSERTIRRRTSLTHLGPLLSELAVDFDRLVGAIVSLRWGFATRLTNQHRATSAPHRCRAFTDAYGRRQGSCHRGVYRIDDELTISRISGGEHATEDRCNEMFKRFEARSKGVRKFLVLWIGMSRSRTHRGLKFGSQANHILLWSEMEQH